MAKDINLVKINGVLLPTQVATSYQAMMRDCFTSTGVILDVIDGFKPKTAIRTELRKRLKSTKYVGKILSNEEFDGIEPTAFEPPLYLENQKALRDSNETVYSIPCHAGVDPRLLGRIIQIGPRIKITPTLLYYLVHNAGNFGFLHYGPKDPTVWYWRGDAAASYTPQEVVNTFTGELSYLL